MTQQATHPFGDPIFVYTRAQAIEDGVLCDISTLAQEAGFKFPVAVSTGVYEVLNAKAEGQDFNGRAWDMLTILRNAIRTAGRTNRVDFAPLFIMPKDTTLRPRPVEMYSHCGPGDQGEPVITIMLPGED